MLILLRSARIGRFPAIRQLSKGFSSSTNKDIQEGIALSNDKRTIICWHPEKHFPYECSLPLPDLAPKHDHSVLKVQATEALKHIYRPKTAEMQRQELMKITYTTKHIWFPCNRRFKTKKTPMDRPYL